MSEKNVMGKIPKIGPRCNEAVMNVKTKIHASSGVRTTHMVNNGETQRKWCGGVF